MSRALGLFRKQPRPALIISRPIQYTERSDRSHQNEEEDEKIMSRSQSKNSLPPRPGPPSNHRVFVFTYTATTLLTLTSIVLFSIAIPLWNENFIHRQPPIKTDWPDTLILVPLLLSLFSSIYLLTISVHRRRKLHPLTPFNLILLSSTILLTLIPSLILVSNNTLAHAFSSINTKSTFPKPSLTTNANQVCNLTNILTRPCLPVLYLIGDLQTAGIVLSTLVNIAWLLILILSIWTFIKNRVAERRRRRESRRRRHARRRGHEHKHRRMHRHKHCGRGDGHDERHATPGSKEDSRSHDKVILPAPWEGSNAVRYAQQKVRAKETIQMWLADRHV